MENVLIYKWENLSFQNICYTRGSLIMETVLVLNRWTTVNELSNEQWKVGGGGMVINFWREKVMVIFFYFLVSKFKRSKITAKV